MAERSKGRGSHLINTVNRGFDKLLSATGSIGIAIMLLLSGFIFSVTLFRYVFRTDIPGLFDLSVYSLVVFPFITVAYAMREKKHISVDAFTSQLSQRTQAVLSIAVHATSLIYVIVLGWQSWLWAANLFKYRVLTPGVFPVPKGIFASIIVFGCFLLLLQIIRVVVSTVRSLPNQASSSALRDNPWLYVFLFIIGIVLSLMVFTQVNTIAGLILLSLIALFSGMPVFLALGLIGVLGVYYLLGSASLLQVSITAYQGVDSFTLTCLPLFILGGLIMEESGIAEDMFRTFELWTGRWVASPLIVSILLGMVFCAISGSSVATTAVVAGVVLPVLSKRGFNKSLSCGIVGGATVGTLIPPSLGYVVYGVITGESVGALFMASILPAAVLFAFYFLYVSILSIVSKKSLFDRGHVPSQISLEHVTWRSRFLILKTAAWGLLTPVIIIGGIYAGIYTPTESAAILVIYAIIVSVFIKRIKWRTIVNGILKSAMISSMILSIIFSAYVFSLVVAQLKIGPAMVAYAHGIGMTSLGMILLLTVVLLIVGCFLEAVAMKLIFLPIFYAPAMAVGINSLWLGVFWQFMSEIGMLTPPVGTNLFVIQGVTGISSRNVIVGNLPFVGMMLLTLVVMYLFPQLVTWLPSTMVK